MKKALSLMQPWPHAVIHLGKRLENRQTWRGCSYRGPILLHASKGTGARDDFELNVLQIMKIVGCAAEQAGAQRRGMRLVPAESLRLGGIVGRAEIVDVIQPSILPRGVPAAKAFADWVARGGDPDQRRWWFGGFALVLDKVEALPFVSWSGALGLFNIDVAEVVRRAEASGELQIVEAYRMLAEADNG